MRPLRIFTWHVHGSYLLVGEGWKRAWRVQTRSCSLQQTHFQPFGLLTVWQVHGSKQQV